MQRNSSQSHIRAKWILVDGLMTMKFYQSKKSFPLVLLLKQVPLPERFPLKCYHGEQWSVLKIKPRNRKSILNNCTSREALTFLLGAFITPKEGMKAVLDCTEQVLSVKFTNEVTKL